MRRLFRVIRWERWAGSKLPLLLGAFLLSIGLTDTTPSLALAGAVQLTVHIVGYASFGYLVNSLADIRQDEAAGKGSVFSGWSMRRARTAVLVSVGIAAGPLIIGADAHPAALGSMGISMVVAAAYSLPPLRLKERGVLGALSSSLAQRSLPALTIFCYFEAYSLAPLVYCALTLVIGLRFILVHQMDDLAADQISGTRTLATRCGAEALKRVVTVLLLPAELLLALCFVVVASPELGLVSWVVAIYAVVHTLLLLLLHDGDRFPLASYAPFSELYCCYLPLGLALAGVLMGGQVLMPIYLVGFAISLTLLPGSLREEFHRIRRLIRSRQWPVLAVAPDVITAARSAAVRALQIAQRGDGSFELLKWRHPDSPVAAHHLFATAWVVIAAGESLTAEARERAARAIESARDATGYWNFDPSMGIPNDIDSTACAMIALAACGRTGDERDAHLLLDQWRHERQRFATWVTDDQSWQSGDRDDPVVNLNTLVALATLHQRVDGAMSGGIEKFLSGAPATSRYYCDAATLPYAAAKAGVPLDRSRHPQWGRPNRRATSTSIAHWITVSSAPDHDLVTLLLQRQRADGSWAADPWFTGVNVPFWGSSALTTAFCIEALARVERSTTV